MHPTEALADQQRVDERRHRRVQRDAARRDLLHQRRAGCELGDRAPRERSVVAGGHHQTSTSLDGDPDGAVVKLLLFHRNFLQPLLQRGGSAGGAGGAAGGQRRTEDNPAGPGGRESGHSESRQGRWVEKI